jgi:hypothetical protein
MAGGVGVEEGEKACGRKNMMAEEGAVSHDNLFPSLTTPEVSEPEMRTKIVTICIKTFILSYDPTNNFAHFY